MTGLLIALAIAAFVPWYHHRRYYYAYRYQEQQERIMQARREMIRTALNNITEKPHE